MKKNRSEKDLKKVKDLTFELTKHWCQVFHHSLRTRHRIFNWNYYYKLYYYLKELTNSCVKKHLHIHHFTTKTTMPNINVKMRRNN